MSKERLEGLSILARQLLDAEAEVVNAELELKACKEKARNLREEVLPSIMQELELSEIRLDTGERVTVKQDVFMELTNEAKPRAYEWLDNNGFGSLIKTAVISTFGRADIEEAKVLVHELSKRGNNVQLKMDIHYQTMKAWLREQLAEGNDIPLDLFGARPVFIAKVK